MKMARVNDYCSVLETDGKMASDGELAMCGEAKTQCWGLFNPLCL